MTKKLTLMICLTMVTLASWAQSVVNGTVVSAADGEPIVGASVRVLGTKIAAITDVKGTFSFNSQALGKKIEVSYVGMKSETMTGKASMLFKLEDDNSVLDEVVVTAFGEQKRSAFAGSAAVVDSKKIEKKQLTNVLSGLQGEAAGVQMTNNSGDPTATPSIRVRGFSSISAGQSPLIIVDGAPYDGGWNNINPADVASVTVLKDASSTALYGARGANGVIMITTKHASVGKATVTLDAKWGSNSRIKRDYETIDNPGQYYETYYKALYNYQRNVAGLSPAEATAAANTQLGAGSSEGGLGYIVYNVPDGQYLIGENGRLNPNATLGNRVYNAGSIYTITPDDWEKEGMRNGFRQEYNMNITGGAEQLQYYASLGYLNNQGIAKSSDYERYTARIKSDYQAKKWLKIGTNINFSHSTYDKVASDGNGLFYEINMMAPIYPVYLRDGNGNILTDSNGRMYDYGNAEVNGLTRPVHPNINPIQDNILNTNKTTDNLFSLYGYGEFSIIDGLKLTINGTVSDYTSKNTTTQNPYYGYWRDNTNGGMVTKENTEYYSYNFQQLLNYKKEFGKNHIEILLGHEYYRQKYSELYGTKKTMASYQTNQNLSGAITVSDTNDESTDYNSEGWFFRGQYDYDQKYFGNVSYRRDASSRFHPDHRWGNFYSVGGAWILTKENWFKNMSWLNTFKLKASFGQQGNDKIGDYLYMDTYTINNTNGSIGYTLNNKGNENITWETNNNYNVGLEFELFGSRIRGSVEYFYKKTTDMLCFVSAPISAGYSGTYDNIGDMSNKGVEIDLSAGIVRTKHITWDVNVNATFYKNKVLKIADDLKGLTVDGHDGYYSNPYFYGEGLPVYTWYLKRYAGVSDEGKSQWYYTDSNGELQKTETYGNADYYISGNPHPTVYGGFGTTLSVYGFDLAISFSYSLGGQAYDYTYASMMSVPTASGGGHSIHKDVLEAWSADNTTSEIPRWYYGDENTGALSDRFLTSASYLTLQNINLGYTFSKKIASKLLLNSLRVYVTADNLYYWSARKGFDPRGTFNGQTSTTSYSPSRTISAGVKVTF